MLSNYIEQLFKLDNYYDGLIVTDNKGYIEFFMTYRPDISGAKQEDLVGKHVLDIYPGLTEETSTIMRVLRSGEPIYNEPAARRYFNPLIQLCRFAQEVQARS